MIYVAPVENVIVPHTFTPLARVCSHCWIDPEIWGTLARRVIPLIGDGPKMMRPGRSYVCLNCQLTLYIPQKGQHDDGHVDRMGSQR